MFRIKSPLEGTGGRGQLSKFMTKIFLLGGGEPLKMSDLKKQLLRQIDVNDQMELEKVERYLDLVRLYRKMDKAVKQYGPIVEGFNGTQTYLKTNPAIAQKVTISRAIIALGKDLNLDDLNGKVVTDNQDDYDESDLT